MRSLLLLSLYYTLKYGVVLTVPFFLKAFSTEVRDRVNG